MLSFTDESGLAEGRRTNPSSSQVCHSHRYDLSNVPRFHLNYACHMHKISYRVGKNIYSPSKQLTIQKVMDRACISIHVVYVHVRALSCTMLGLVSVANTPEKHFTAAVIPILT